MWARRAATAMPNCAFCAAEMLDIHLAVPATPEDRVVPALLRREGLRLAPAIISHEVDS